jgi:pimeloyl-ACP methyl ester carboxylesterase
MITPSRRSAMTIAAAGAVAGAGLWLTGCAMNAPSGNTMPSSSPADLPPIVFVHGNGDTAALWQTTVWRFESNGWPAGRLYAVDMPQPLARDDDTKPQAGRGSAAESMAYVKATVDRVLATTGARQVVLVGNSRGGYAIRNYIQNGGGAATVSHAVLGGTPNHGVWAIKGFRELNEFSGTGPFLTALNAPKNAAGDEVTGPVRWLTLRSDRNDKFAQPDGLWIGTRGTPTNVTYEGPALKGATNRVLNGADHRETSFSPAAFAATYQFITGVAPAQADIVPQALPVIVLDGKINSAENLPLPGTRVQVFAVDPATGSRKGDAVHSKTVGADGFWGPFAAAPGTAYEFVVEAPGYAITHIYRSPFPRGTALLHMRPERLADADREAKSVVVFTRPRGYFDAQRDAMTLDGQTALPGVPPQGAGVSAARLRLARDEQRPVTGRFNAESLTGQTWPVAGNHVTVLELTY